MPNWKSKMFVKITDDVGTETLTPIVDINPVINTPHTPEHSLEDDNVGVTKGNDTFTFSLTVKALRSETTGTNPVKRITELQTKHKMFQIVMLERQISGGDGKDWAFTSSLVLDECYVNQSNPTRATLNASPVATFNCMSKGITVDGNSYHGL